MAMREEKRGTIGFWNVMGLRNKNTDYWEKLKEWEMIVLVETWVERKGWERISRRLLKGIYGGHNGRKGNVRKEGQKEGC